jgi:uncharacterized protein
MPNALAQETSPYLRQHSENPVDWLPWGPVAFERARALDRPLLVSIGYSACHWCHVMERESFADQTTAELMNDQFVCVKVDREERPDVDALYMEAVQALAGQGGWPLNVFLTPEQLPFYGGTYFPPEPRHGMPSWTQVLDAITEAWRERRERIVADGGRLQEHLSRGAMLAPADEPVDQAVLDTALEGLRAAFDQRNGGFGHPPTHAPKFPHASAIELMLLAGSGMLAERGIRAQASVPPLRQRVSPGPAGADDLARPDDRYPSAKGNSTAGARADARDMALRALLAMAAGGIYDQLGGGFHRYSVDAAWTVPHFEKMLYDSALLARAYLHAWQATGDARLAEVCRQTLDWTLREMKGPEGGFYSALDADSDGIEGAYYVWTLDQLHDALGFKDAEAAAMWLGVTAAGNFEDGPGSGKGPGLCVLSARGPVPDEATRERIRGGLLRARVGRTRPALDDKRLTAWNALMIAALADAGASLAEPRYTEAAVACAEFVLDQLRDERRRLLRVHDGKDARIGAFLEDHAYLLEALLVLFETTCEERWFEEAIAIADTIIAKFADDERGGFYSTATDAPEALIVRRKDFEDTPIPSGASSATAGLLRLAQLTGSAEYERRSTAALRLLAPPASKYPTAFGHALQAVYWYLAPARPIACEVPSRAAGP